MPCNSDHMKASGTEIAASRLFCFLDETQGREWKRSWFEGYHPEAYCKRVTKEQMDAMTRRLCKFLQTEPVEAYSLELQMWWRDHQKADKERLERELKEHEDAEAREAALSKLTDHEKRLLGIDQ